MKRIVLLVLGFFCLSEVPAQQKTVARKYPSLLWEITGKGINKPSYLIGTMHVSSKLAFNLPDSFYFALRNAQVVALETNPETWQEDMSKYDLGQASNFSSYGNYNAVPGDYLTINTLKFYKYDSKIEHSLYSSPSTINNLLYRTYGNETSDFEEDTYLDMYIFQCGKKWGKKVTGVENYGESMKLMAEAYRDASKDKNRKERSYDDNGEEFSASKLQEAYRTGNLDLLDSINKYNSFSEAFDEKFLYRRNDIQARSIDSIIRSGAVLFVGVGAAHLPGDRGVIEILRRQGYRLRPVKMGERASREKEQVEKIRVPVSFRTESSEDGFFKVDIPGKFYLFGEDPALDQRQYADMANGSYYMVTRVMTNAWLWNHSTADVYKRIDSLLYENVPGKIITKTAITKNGYSGFDLVNRTRRGDLQRYQIFITPFEVIFFKMSGNGDYVKDSDEAKKFFTSIQLQEYRNKENVGTGMKKYSPSYGGFSVDLPHEPYTGNDGSWIYDAEDKATGAWYRVVRTDIHNYHFVEEDSFDLGLMEESFTASEFIDSQFLRKQGIHKGYPVLDGKYRDKDGSVFLVRYLIQGPHYYTLIAHGKKENPAMDSFINSFEIKPFVYGAARLQTDSALYYSVTTPVFPQEKKIRINIPRYSYYEGGKDDEYSEKDLLQEGVYRSRTISNDSTGEKIFVSFFRSPGYYYRKDSIATNKDNEESFFDGDSAWITRSRKKTILPGNIKVQEVVISDTGSSRVLWGKSFYKNGIGFSLATETDTLSDASPFVKQFFESFMPSNTLEGVDPFVKKSALFFSDLASTDSVLHKRAVKNISVIKLDSTDLPLLEKAITGLNWNEKNYLDTKQSLINKTAAMGSTATANYLKHLYYALDDTVQLQYVVLENLLQLRTTAAYNVFREILNTEPPVLDAGSGAGDYINSAYRNYLNSMGGGHGYSNGNFLDELSDSLELTKTILPDLLPLLNLDDYKKPIMQLLSSLVESRLSGPADYQTYFSKFLIEAKQELKKQSIREKKKAIEKAEENKAGKNSSYSYSDDDDEKGNDILGLYATLLLPFWETETAVQPILQQMLRSNDKELKYNALLLLIGNNKPFPDSLLKYFAGLDEYRYELYNDLQENRKLEKFPVQYNNHIALGKSSLLSNNSYDKPDSIAYVDRVMTEYRGKNGYAYFYKYRLKKDDLSWKLAVVGLVPTDPKEFEFMDTAAKSPLLLKFEALSSSRYNQYRFTKFTDTRVKEDEPLASLLKKELKKIQYSLRKSAQEFYEEETDRSVSVDNLD